MTPQIEMIENELVNQISRDNLWETNRRIAERVRLSGSPDERTIFEYVRRQLDEYGLRTTWLEHPALVSYPVDSSLQVIDDIGRTLAQYKCTSHAFSASVDKLEAQVIDLGDARETDFANNDMRGKIALINGLATPTAVYAAERVGCIGEIFINDNHLHNMIVSTVWGTPTPESAKRLPHTPAVSIVRADGIALRKRLANGNVRVQMRTQVFRDWQTTPIVIGELDGRVSRDFIMFSGHLDSWHYGAMDNGSANATMLQVARLLAQQKDKLYRGLRVIFWSGHSHGRYSGSTWYADNFWQELYDRCVAHVNIDSTGARDATYYGSFPAHLELGKFGAEIVEKYTGQKTQPYRMSRAGDMSFNGIGIPSLFMELSQVPVGHPTSLAMTTPFGDSTGGEMPWWWHTDEDTMDKVDVSVLALDTQVYLSTLWRLCSSPLLPMDFRPVLDDLNAELADLARVAGNHLALDEIQKRAEMLMLKVNELAERISRANASDEIEQLNEQMKKLSRILIPLTYTLGGQFDHDPAWHIPFLASLQSIRQLPKLDAHSDEYQFLKTQLVRNCNAVAFTLRQALELFSR